MFSRGQPRYYTEEQALLPPLGLLYIAGYLLEKAPRHHVRVLDMPVLGLDLKGLAAILKDFKPDIVGISCLTNLLWDTVQTARAVKRLMPDLPVVMGGFHTQAYPRETLQMPEVDALVLGAGEIAFSHLLDGLESTGKIPRLPGVLIDPEYCGEVSEEIQVIKNPDLLPLPARHLTPYDKYYSATSITPPTTVMITSFGCPFRCIFCNTSRIQKIVSRSPQRIVEEFSACAKLGIREITIQDENFTVNRARVIEATEEIQRKSLDLIWSFKARVDLVDRELLRAVRKAGCQSVHFGVESGDPDILKEIRKDITPDQARRAFRLAKEEGLETTAAFMIGFPGESREQIEKTISFALEIDPNYVQFSITIPLPKTDLYTMAFERGLFHNDHWQAFAKDPTPDFQPPGWYEDFTAEQMLALLESAYRRFYLRPRYILSRIRKLKSLSELKRNIRIGLRFFFAQMRTVHECFSPETTASGHQ